MLFGAVRYVQSKKLYRRHPSSFRLPCRTPYSLWPALRLGRLDQCVPSVQLGRDGSTFNHHLPETYQARIRVACCCQPYGSLSLLFGFKYSKLSCPENPSWPADLRSLRVLRIRIRAFTTESKEVSVQRVLLLVSPFTFVTD